MFGPRFDHEGFNEARWNGRVIIETPTIRAVAQPLDAHTAHRHGKIVRARGVDRIFDGYQYRTGVGPRFTRQDWFGPVRRRREIDFVFEFQTIPKRRD